MKTYLPQLAKEMNYLGKYIFEHKEKIFNAIDADEDLTPEEKEAMKQVLWDITTVHSAFRRLNRKLG